MLVALDPHTGASPGCRLYKTRLASPVRPGLRQLYSQVQIAEQTLSSSLSDRRPGSCTFHNRPFPVKAMLDPDVSYSATPFAGACAGNCTRDRSNVPSVPKPVFSATYCEPAMRT